MAISFHSITATVYLLALMAFPTNVTFAQDVNIPSTLAVGSTVINPSTATKSLDELMTRTVGSVSGSAISRYGADFDSYWQASRSSREGKALEAIATDIVNHRNAATGISHRWATSASLGSPTHAADILELDASGKIVRQIQAGKGYSNVMNKLSDPKYAGMDILTDQNTFDALRKELHREANRAKAIGRPLKPKFVILQGSIDSGRLLNRLPCGAPLPTQDHITKIARKHAQKLFGVQASKVSTKVARSSKVVAVHANDITDGALQFTKASSRLVRAVPLAATGYEAYQAGCEVTSTEQQFANGQINAQQREVRHAQTAGRVGGGIFGAYIGAKAVGTAGGAVGSLGGPFGTAIGAGVGGVVGGIGGALGGEKLLTEGAEIAMDAVHSTGTTISESASSAWSWTAESSASAWNWATGN